LECMRASGARCRAAALPPPAERDYPLAKGSNNTNTHTLFAFIFCAIKMGGQSGLSLNSVRRPEAWLRVIGEPEAPLAENTRPQKGMHWFTR
jgi:hypothetical protein